MRKLNACVYWLIRELTEITRYAVYMMVLVALLYMWMEV
jgi:hypothetical protein